MKISSKRDVAKYISKYIVFEFIALIIVTNIHDIINILLTKIKLPIKLIDNILNFVDMSSGLIGFAISCVLAVMCISTVNSYYKNRGEHETANNLSNNIRSKLEEARLNEIYIESSAERQIDTEIKISGIDEIKTMDDIEYHKRLNKRQ